MNIRNSSSSASNAIKEVVNNPVAGCLGMIVAVVFALVLIVVWDGLWSAWALSTLWNDYLRVTETFSFLPVLTKSAAIIFATLVTYLIRSARSGKKNEDSNAHLWSIALAPVAAICTVAFMQIVLAVLVR